MSAVNVSANRHTHPKLTCVPFTGQQGCQSTDHSPSHTTGYFWGNLGTFPQIFLTTKAGSCSISICDRYDQNSLFFLKSNNVYWTLTKVVSLVSRLASVRVTERWFRPTTCQVRLPELLWVTNHLVCQVTHTLLLEKSRRVNFSSWTPISSPTESTGKHHPNDGRTGYFLCLDATIISHLHTPGRGIKLNKQSDVTGQHN